MVAQRYYTSYMPTERANQTSVTVRFPQEVLEAMRKLAQDDARSLNSEIIVALREFIKQRQQANTKQAS